MDNRELNNTPPRILGIIDADGIVWASAWLNRDIESLEEVMYNVDSRIEHLINGMGCTHYTGFLQGEKSFREDHFDDYKANRPPKPEWMTRLGPNIVSHMIANWGFTLVNKMEVDDAVASLTKRLREQNLKYVIYSPDKDLKQVQGDHYIPGKGIVHRAKEQADWMVALQALMGDATDNIRGIPGIGIKKAEALLTNSKNYFHTVIDAYINHFGVRKGLYELGKTLILTTLQEDFEIPTIWHPYPRIIEQTQKPDNQEETK